MNIKKICDRLNEDPAYFVATLFRWAFGLLFILVAVKKFRMGYVEFVDSIVHADTILAGEIPSFLLIIYAYLLPIAELVAGILLIVNKQVSRAYQVIALVYLTFIFGQEYNGNTSKVGTEYLPSLVALSIAYYTYHKSSKEKA